MKQPKRNGVATLDEKTEAIRMQVIEAELKARYWKATYELKHYTLEADKIHDEYERYIEKEKIKHEELQRKFMEEMEEVRQNMIDKGELKAEPVVTGDPSEIE